MFSAAFKLAFRNLLRQKTFSAINIFGLALSMAVCLHFLSVIREAHTYDTFHPDPDRTYRILTEAIRKEGGSEPYASSPYRVARALKEDYAQVETWTPLVQHFSGEIQTRTDQLYIRGYYTDSTFFETLGFGLQTGDQTKALTQPYSILLSHDLALKVTGDEDDFDALTGTLMEVAGYPQPFTITGILKPFPGKSHLQFDAIASLATQLALEKQPDAYVMTDEWRDYYATYNFVKLKEGTDRKTAEGSLADIAANKFEGLELESRDAGYRYTLQGINEITPGRMLSQSTGNGIPSTLLWFLSVLGLIIILIASFNYTNLTIARSLVRTKEVGVRKVLGANRNQVFWQLMGESVLVSFLSLILAYGILKSLKSVMLRMNFTEFADAGSTEDPKLYGLFILFAIGVGGIAGVLPAAVLSRTTPLQMLSKLQNVKMLQKVGLRKAMLGFQFTVTLIFLFMMTIAWRQVNHATQMTFGFDQPNTLLVNLNGAEYPQSAAALASVQGVSQISGISHTMGTWADSYIDVRSDSVTEKQGVRDYVIDHHYLNHFKLPLVAGENFPENLQQQNELFVLVNETFCREYGLGDATEAVGKSLTLGDSTPVVVRGVVKDFFFRPSTYGMEPLLLRYSPAHLSVLNLEIRTTDVTQTMAALERTWKSIAPESTFDAEFYDAAVRRNYEGYMSTVRLVGFLGALGLIIACLGLLGMTIYTVETRAREVSIRKVMGAGFSDVIMMLSKGYFLVLMIAMIIAIPVSFLLGTQLVQEFAQRASWSAWVFIPGILLMFIFAGAIISSQTIRAALADPVKTLRAE